jgi:translation elongation factor EF-Ts
MTHFHRHISSYVHLGRIGVLVEFDVPERTAQDTAFLAIARSIAMHIAASGPESLDALLNESYLVDPDITVAELLRESAIVLQTCFAITRFVRWTTELEEPTQFPDPPRAPAIIQRVA